MTVRCTNFGGMRAYACARALRLYRNAVAKYVVNLCEKFAAGSTFWARRKFEFAALEFLLPMGVFLRALAHARR